MPERLRLPRALREALLEWAQASPGEEICGLISGTQDQARRLYPIANVASDRARLFELDPKGQIDAIRAMREAGERLLAIYHSHPRGPAAPSHTDIEHHAYPDAYCLVIAPSPWRVRAFRLRAREAEEIVVLE